MEEKNLNETLETQKLDSVKTNGKKKNSKRKHIVLYIVTILFLVGIGFLLYKRLTVVKEVDFSALPSVNVTHIRRGSIDKEISVMGNILPNDTYYVPAKVGGDIKQIFVKNGDYVKKGDPICEIDASKEIEAAFIQYDTARKAYERMQKLYSAGDISLQNFESVKAQYEAAKLAYDTKVEYSVPVAVGDGIVENTNMTINTSIKVETVLCYITSEEAKEINFGVTERVLSGIKLGDKVVIEKSGMKYDGYISDIANLINTSNGLFNVKAVITSKNNFASGIMAKVSFVYDRRRNVNILPNELVYYEAGNAYLYTVDDNNIIRKTYVDVGIENETTTEILTDVDKKMKIVSTWNNDLAEGATVNIVKDEEVYDEIDLEEEAASKKETTIEVVESTTSEIVEEDNIKDIDNETKNIKSSNSEIVNNEELKTDIKKQVIASDSEFKITAVPKDILPTPFAGGEITGSVKITEVK